MWLEEMVRSRQWIRLLLEKRELRMVASVQPFSVAINNSLQKYLAYLKHPNHWKSAFPENLLSAVGVDLGHEAPLLAHRSPSSQASPEHNARRSVWHPQGYSQAIKICGRLSL